ALLVTAPSRERSIRHRRAVRRERAQDGTGESRCPVIPGSRAHWATRFRACGVGTRLAQETVSRGWPRLRTRRHTQAAARRRDTRTTFVRTGPGALARLVRGHLWDHDNRPPRESGGRGARATRRSAGGQSRPRRSVVVVSTGLCGAA